MMVTSGTMTNRIDRLAEKGLVRRIPDPEDRRGILVELTEQGRELIDSALIAHVANEALLLQPLSREEQHTLAALLRKWLASLEHRSLLMPLCFPGLVSLLPFLTVHTVER